MLRPNTMAIKISRNKIKPINPQPIAFQPLEGCILAFANCHSANSLSWIFWNVT